MISTRTGRPRAPGAQVCPMDTLTSVDQIIEMHAKLEGPKILMAARRHGGAGKSGRYLRHDTARLHFIDGQALRDLAGGKMPSADNHRALFEIAGDLEIKGTALEKEMDAWYDKHYAEPRSKKHADAGLSKLRQTSLQCRRFCTTAWSACRRAVGVQAQLRSASGHMRAILSWIL